MSTTRDSVQHLIKNVLSRLENQKVIEFDVQNRQAIQSEIYDRLSGLILTDQDLHEQTLEKIGASAEDLEEQKASESAQYRTARSIVRKSFGDDELNGFYYQKSLKHIADEFCQYFMSSSHIDDVFESDDEIAKRIVDTVKKFNPAHSH